MGEDQYASEIRAPRDYSAADLDAFAACVRDGGKVAPNVRQRLGDALHLGVVRHGDAIVGTVAIKTPSPNYRAKCFRNAGSAQDPTRYPLELGWAYMDPDHRDAKRMSPLLARIVRLVDDTALFATTQIDNDAMKHMLAKNGFVSDGNTYASDLGDEELVLFLRKANETAS